MRTKTNYSGGIQGGITNGEPIIMRAAFKPTATIIQDQDSVNEENEEVTFKAKGRHDPALYRVLFLFAKRWQHWCSSTMP